MPAGMLRGAEKRIVGETVDELGQNETDELNLQKREAFARFSAVWKDALGAGIEPEVLAHVALFAALGDLVATYGEIGGRRFRRAAARAHRGRRVHAAARPQLTSRRFCALRPSVALLFWRAAGAAG